MFNMHIEYIKHIHLVYKLNVQLIYTFNSKLNSAYTLNIYTGMAMGGGAHCVGEILNQQDFGSTIEQTIEP